MSCFLKLMGRGDDYEMLPLPDLNAVAFDRQGSMAFAVVKNENGAVMRRIELIGNAYVLNNEGKTVETFRHAR